MVSLQHFRCSAPTEAATSCTLRRPPRTKVAATQPVYAETKTDVTALTEGSRQEAGPNLRVTLISPGFTHTEGIGKSGSPEIAAAMLAQGDAIAMPPSAIAHAIAFAIEQPDRVDIGEIVVRPTAQG